MNPEAPKSRVAGGPRKVPPEDEASGSSGSGDFDNSPGYRKIQRSVHVRRAEGQAPETPAVSTGAARSSGQAGPTGPVRSPGQAGTEGPGGSPVLSAQDSESLALTPEDAAQWLRTEGADPNSSAIPFFLSVDRKTDSSESSAGEGCLRRRPDPGAGAAGSDPPYGSHLRGRGGCPGSRECCPPPPGFPPRLAGRRLCRRARPAPGCASHRPAAGNAEQRNQAEGSGNPPGPGSVLPAGAASRSITRHTGYSGYALAGAQRWKKYMLSSRNSYKFLTIFPGICARMNEQHGANMSRTIFF